MCRRLRRYLCSLRLQKRVEDCGGLFPSQDRLAEKKPPVECHRKQLPPDDLRRATEHDLERNTADAIVSAMTSSVWCCHSTCQASGMGRTVSLANRGENYPWVRHQLPCIVSESKEKTYHLESPTAGRCGHLCRRGCCGGGRLANFPRTNLGSEHYARHLVDVNR
jgi:hypothetical protein